MWFSIWQQPAAASIYTGWVKKVSCCAVIDISKARQHIVLLTLDTQ